MTRIDTTKVKWRIQVRRKHTWKNAGLFETRSVARAVAKDYRADYGFGNTRVVRRVKGQPEFPKFDAFCRHVGKGK